MSDKVASRSRSTLEEWLRDVQGAIEVGEIDRAASLAADALAADWVHPGLLSLRALKFEKEDRFDEACADLQRAVELEPRDYGSWNALGLCLTKLNRFSEAVDALDAAIKLAPDFAQAHNNRGFALENLAELERAVESFERAASLMPVFVEPRASLSGLALRRGDVASARRWALAATACAAMHPKAQFALAAVYVAEKNFEAAIELLNQVISTAEAPPWDKVLACGLLGDALDGLKRPHDAFLAFSECNRRSFDIVRARFEGPNVETMPKYLGWLTNYFQNFEGDAWRVPLVAPADAASQTHVFLVGFPRSGTTLVEHVLASHPDVSTLEEKQTLDEGIVDFLADADDLAVLEKMSSAELDAYRRAYWRRVQQFGVDLTRKVFVDKNPFNSVKLPLISKLFPRAKIVFAIRDPRDVVLSCFSNRFAINSMTFEFMTLAGTARLYDGVMTLSDLFRAKIGMREHLIIHERTVADFEIEIERLCDFLEIGWNDSLKHFADQAKGGRVGTVSGPQLAEGLNARGIGRWRRYEADLSPIFPILQPWVDRFGY